MKKILFLTYGALPFPPVEGGAVESLLEIFCKENEKKPKYRITIISKKNKEAEKVAKQFLFTRVIYVDVKRKMKIGTLAKRSLRKIVKYLTNKRITPVFYPEIIEVAKQELKQNTCDIVVSLNAVEQVLPIKKVYSGELYLYLHNDYLNIFTSRAKIIANSCTKIITVCDALKDEITKIKGVKRELRIYTAKNGIDIEKFYINKQETRNRIRQKLNIPLKDTVIVFSGRLTRTKGAHYLIEAVKQLPSLENVSLLIIGGIDYSNLKKDAYFNYLQRLSKPISEKVFFSGYIPSQNIPEYLVAADLSIIPSDFFETCCLSMLEAQAAGLPTIVSDVGGIKEYTNTRSSIILTMDRNFVANLTKKISLLLNSQEHCIKMSEAATLNAMTYTKTFYFEQLCRAIDYDGERT
ncbi:glycosyltransferase family 4 protein [Enterococcus lactis]|uniref:glycosyltransferase family 4 protein n=1 Tax=Enterococcus lactis TaxID=357441 RepID=UPI003D99B12B